MALGPFAHSRALSLGVELELQLVNPHDYDLTGAASDLLRLLPATQPSGGEIKLEITASMIEISTGVCNSHDEALLQLSELRSQLCSVADRLNIGICGGGTHPFQHWGAQRITESARYQYLSDLYGYLAKQFTVFGQHVHVGCPAPDEALYLLHSLSAYIPHFIALSASSPYVQGHDTGFDSARLNSIFAFPLSGRAPFVETWEAFNDFFTKMEHTGVVQSMKDFYWDIRPKPEYGTIEVRVMDTPLTIARAAHLAGYIQALCRYLLVERPHKPSEDDYLVYTFNRFQACRFGFAGTYVDPRSHAHTPIGDDILATLHRIEQHAIEIRADHACRALQECVQKGRNDAAVLREEQERTGSLAEVVRRQCGRWRQ
ncbi:MAG: glutamate--cysteine ligase [Zoogloea sp.]|nr:glutamate--cysteine ligase [Zoogloea sp.]